MLLKTLAGGPFAVNCYLMVDEKTLEAAVVDPGVDWEGIYQIILNDGYQVRWIINTHGHPDHTGGNAYLKRKTGAPLLIHTSDAPSLLLNVNR